MDNKLDRDTIVQQARRYLGIPYTHYHGRIFVDQDGKLKGKVSCLSFILYLSRDIGILTDDTNFNLDRMGRDSNWLQLAEEMLQSHCVRVPKEKALRGDLFKMRYLDVDRNAPWHVAIKSTDEGMPTGSIIHAVNYNLNGGSVVENRLDLIEWNRVDSAWRLKGLID